MSYEELTAAMQAQASVPVDQAAIRRAVETVLEDVTVSGNHLKHRYAAA